MRTSFIERWLPGWLWQTAQLQPTPVPLRDCVRAMIAVGLPAVAGLTTGHIAEAALMALGALPVITGDQGGPYRTRLVSIGTTVLAGMAGYAVGGLCGGHGALSLAVQWLLLILLSLAGTWGNVSARATLQCAIYLIVGAGVHTPLPFWHLPLLMGCGGLFGMALTLLGWLVHPDEPEQQVVADIYRCIGALLAAPDKTTILQARRDLHTATTRAYDTLITARRAAAGRDARLQRLVAQLMAATPLMNASLALIRRERQLPDAVARVIYDLASQIARGVPADARTAADRLHLLGLASIDATLVDTLRGIAPLLSGLSTQDHALSGLVRARQRKRVEWRLARRAFRPGHEVRLYLLRIGLCLAAAEIVAALTPLPRAYWVPLVVVVVFKPNFGSIFARAVQCCAGSVLGIGLSAAILAFDRSGTTSLVAVALLSFALPWGLKRNYGLFSALLLPIIMLLIGALQPGSWPIALARLADATVASLIVVLIGYLPWARYDKLQLNERVAGAIDALRAYLDAAYGADPVRGYTQRRLAYGALSDVRIALQRAMAEPAPVGRHAALWWPVNVSLERVANAITDGMIAERLAAHASTDETRRSTAAPRAPAGALTPFTEALRALSSAVRLARAPDAATELPDTPRFKELAGEIDALRAVIASIYPASTRYRSRSAVPVPAVRKT